MSLIENELGQIHTTRQEIKGHYSKGNLTLKEYLQYDLEYLRVSTNKQNVIAQLLVSAAKHGKTIESKSIDMNLLGDGDKINTEGVESEKILCPVNRKMITRYECLEYSGDHIEDCTSCSHNKDTKRLLIDQA